MSRQISSSASYPQDKPCRHRGTKEKPMPKVIHFELPAADPERAVKFYADVFGWKSEKWDGPQDYWMLLPSDDYKADVTGGVMRQADCPDGMRSSINIIGVESVDAYVAKIEAAGGKIVMPKMHIPTIGWLAYAQDTEGISFGIMQSENAGE
jgi:uncharacterized protein